MQFLITRSHEVSAHTFKFSFKKIGSGPKSGLNNYGVLMFEVNVNKCMEENNLPLSSFKRLPLSNFKRL